MVINHLKSPIIKQILKEFQVFTNFTQNFYKIQSS